MDIETGDDGEAVAADEGAPPEAPAGGHDRDVSQKAAAGGIDLAVLTAKVYRLMRDELRLEHARGVAMRNR